MDTKSIVDRLANPTLLKQDEPAAWDAMLRRYPSFAIGRMLQFGVHHLKDDGDIKLAALYKADPFCFANMFKQLDSDSLSGVHADHSGSGSIPESPQVQSESFEINETAIPLVVHDVTELVKPIVETHDLAAETTIHQPEQSFEFKPEPQQILEEIQHRPEDYVITTDEDILELIQELPNSDPFELPGVAEPVTPSEIPAFSGLESDDESNEEDKSLMVMMSFTDWLKHFKHKSETEQQEEKSRKALKASWQKEKLAEAADEELDEIPEPIFKQAMESITMESSLMSESLAEILARQGKIEKAVAMYKKLSLRNPEKSAYFADRIHELNTKHD